MLDQVCASRWNGDCIRTRRQVAEDRAIATLGDIGFTQVDDFFAIRSDSTKGDDDVVWLLPLIEGHEVSHESGPFDGLRLTFNVLRHPPDRAATFVAAVRRLATTLPVVARYREGESLLAADQLIQLLSRDIKAIQAHWTREGIVCGSDEALRKE